VEEADNIRRLVLNLQNYKGQKLKMNGPDTDVMHSLQDIYQITGRYGAGVVLYNARAFREPGKIRKE